ncbi:ABC transporter substrate-binding protein [Thiomicrorhabdus xiamenensis]|uniref:ABC transporter substrate-binding protein n=1 Tax=Thiomicrorhabdus xiamenensis TaxID=2739063 RepID=A0A7D4NY17_9GAMM|nr:ABC transporter substrate-binding protein [Thiomicrorhabdus xiamenensis]QKI88938.1 ABC transporter substrate-binding protein [Thiomicrorhabdus xiamenensis]
MRVLLILLALISFLGCSRETELHVGVHPWIGYQPINLAQQNGLLPQNIHLVKNKTALQTKQQLLSGEINAGYLTLDEVLSLREQGKPLSVVLITDISSGADKVLAKTPVTGKQDIIGKTIAYERGAVGDLLLYQFLKFYGVAKSEVVLKHIPFDKQSSFWKSGAADMIITYDPVSTQIMRSGAQEVFNSSQIPEMIIDVLAVDSNVLEDACSTIKQLVDAHFAGVSLIKDNFQESSYQIADNLGFSHEEVLTSLGGITLPSREINLQMFGDNRFFEKTREIALILKASGMLKSVPDKAVHTDQCL